MISGKVASACRNAAQLVACKGRLSIARQGIAAISRAHFSVDSASDDDFKPKRKVQPVADDPKALYPLIKKTIESSKVVLYMKGTPQQPMCGFSAQVVRVLNQHGVEIHGVNILEDAMMRQAMKDFSSWPTFPQLYVKGEFIGGCDIVTQLHQSGELKGLLETVTVKA